MMLRIFTLVLLFNLQSILSQEEINLDVDGQDLIELDFDKNSILLNLSSNAGAYKPKGDDGLIKILDIENGTVLNKQNFKKGADVKSFDRSGVFISSEQNGAVINVFNKGERVLYTADKSVVLDLNAPILKELLYYNTQIFEDKVIYVGPTKDSKKSDNPEWVIFETNYEENKSKDLRFRPKVLNNSDDNNSYTVSSIESDGIYLINSTYEGGRSANKKKNLILKYDFSGSLVDEFEFEHNIDSETYSFTGLGFIGTYNTITKPGLPSVRTLSSSSFGKIFMKSEQNVFYYLSCLNGKKKADGTILYLAKYDLDGNLIWENKLKFSEKAVSSKELKYISFEPLIVNDKIMLFEDSRAYLKKFEDIDLFSLNDSDGEIIKSLKFDKIKGINKRGQTWHTIISGKISPEGLSSDHILNNKTLLAYNLAKPIKDFLDNDVIDKETFYYTHFYNGHYYLLKCDYREMKYKLYKF